MWDNIINLEIDFLMMKIKQIENTLIIKLDY